MTDDDARAAADLWDHANDIDGKIRDIAKRITQASTVLAGHTGGNWQEGARLVNEMGKTAKRSQKATKKLLSLAAKGAKKPKATDIADFIKNLKKSDKEIYPFDKAVSSFTIWKRKEEKEIKGALGHTNVDMIVIMKYVDMYIKYRSVFNTKLQSFQRRGKL